METVGPTFSEDYPPPTALCDPMEVVHIGEYVFTANKTENELQLYSTEQILQQQRSIHRIKRRLKKRLAMFTYPLIKTADVELAISLRWYHALSLESEHVQKGHQELQSKLLLELTDLHDFQIAGQNASDRETWSPRDTYNRDAGMDVDNQIDRALRLVNDRLESIARFKQNLESLRVTGLSIVVAMFAAIVSLITALR
ncbi:MAG: hypothetical protein RLN76_00835 [Phycisphaeraceae bacterium]